MTKSERTSIVLFFVVLLGLCGALWAGQMGPEGAALPGANVDVELARALQLMENQPIASEAPSPAGIDALLAGGSMSLSSCDGTYCTESVAECEALCYSINCGFKSWGDPHTNDCRCSDTVF